MTPVPVDLYSRSFHSSNPTRGSKSRWEYHDSHSTYANSESNDVPVTAASASSTPGQAVSGSSRHRGGARSRRTSGTRTSPIVRGGVYHRRPDQMLDDLLVPRSASSDSASAWASASRSRRRSVSERSELESEICHILWLVSHISDRVAPSPPPEYARWRLRRTEYYRTTSVISGFSFDEDERFETYDFRPTGTTLHYR